jgi:superoxide dismutase, Cu-Zn family
MRNFLIVLFSTLLFAAAGADHHDHDGHRAVAVLRTTSAWQAPQSDVMGVVYFEEKGDVVHVTGHIKGLEPNSKHGFHIHQYGDETKDDGTSAGGHFNPHSKPHAGPDAAAHHAGDLGNVVADENGEVKIDIEAKWLQIDAGPHAVLGRAVVIHAGPDDLTSQPSGAAGPRIGVGVVGWANPESR